MESLITPVLVTGAGMEAEPFYPGKLFAILWVAAWIVGGLLVITLSMTRCRRCRKWHEDKDEQDKCEGKHYEK